MEYLGPTSFLAHFRWFIRLCLLTEIKSEHVFIHRTVFPFHLMLEESFWSSLAVPLLCLCLCPCHRSLSDALCSSTMCFEEAVQLVFFHPKYHFRDGQVMLSMIKMKMIIQN